MFFLGVSSGAGGEVAVRRVHGSNCGILCLQEKSKTLTNRKSKLMKAQFLEIYVARFESTRYYINFQFMNSKSFNRKYIVHLCTLYTKR